MAGCHGLGDEHCCWIGGVPCPFLEEGTVEGRRWVCGLLRELGSWDAVYEDERYRAADVAAWFAENYPGFGCGDWPQSIPEVMSTPGTGRCCYG